MKMTPKQVRFVDEYLIDMNASRAAIAAGFSRRSAKVQGSRLLTNVNVKALVVRYQCEAEHRLQITRDGVVMKLVDAAEMAYKNNDPRGMISAMSEVSKMLGYYKQGTPKAEVSGDFVELKKQLAAMSDRELMDFVGDEDTL